jgi:release factor glutamine methyltransferase
MLTVIESINLSAKYLGEKGIDSPRLNAELLLAHVLNCNRMSLYLSFEKPLAEEEIVLYRQLLKRRARREPVQYILGYTEFYGIKLKVNNSVLIPRPETELLIEAIIEKYKAHNKLKILDIGTGSGNIAIALAKNLAEVSIISTDISPDALKIAEENSRLNFCEDKIQFIISDALETAKPDRTFDVIVSNPPYISIKEYNSLEPELKFYEPRIALTDENDGFFFYNRICENAKLLLKPGGTIFFEICFGGSKEVSEILKRNNFRDTKIKKDYQNIDRIISGIML